MCIAYSGILPGQFRMHMYILHIIYAKDRLKLTMNRGHLDVSTQVKLSILSCTLILIITTSWVFHRINNFQMFLQCSLLYLEMQISMWQYKGWINRHLPHLDTTHGLYQMNRIIPMLLRPNSIQRWYASLRKIWQSIANFHCQKILKCNRLLKNVL